MECNFATTAQLPKSGLGYRQVTSDAALQTGSLCPQKPLNQFLLKHCFDFFLICEGVRHVDVLDVHRMRIVLNDRLDSSYKYAVGLALGLAWTGPLLFAGRRLLVEPVVDRPC